MAYGEMSPGEHKFSLLGARPRVVDCHSKQATCGLVFFCYTCDCVRINCLTHVTIINIIRITQNIYFLNTLKK